MSLGTALPPPNSTVWSFNLRGLYVHICTLQEEVEQSLFRSSLPGIPSLKQMEQLNLDHIVLKAKRLGPLYTTSDLVGWETKAIGDWPGIKAAVAELVAALGPDCLDVICLDLVSGRGEPQSPSLSPMHGSHVHIP